MPLRRFLRRENSQKHRSLPGQFHTQCPICLRSASKVPWTFLTSELASFLLARLGKVKTLRECRAFQKRTNTHPRLAVETQRHVCELLRVSAVHSEHPAASSRPHISQHSSSVSEIKPCCPFHGIDGHGFASIRRQYQWPGMHQDESTFRSHPTT